MTDRNPFDTLRENPFIERETTGPLAGHVADGLGHTNPAATCRCATIGTLCNGCGLDRSDLAKDENGNHKNCVATAHNLGMSLDQLRAYLERDRTMQERHPIDREAARRGFTE